MLLDGRKLQNLLEKLQLFSGNFSSENFAPVAFDQIRLLLDKIKIDFFIFFVRVCGFACPRIRWQSRSSNVVLSN